MQPICLEHIYDYKTYPPTAMGATFWGGALQKDMQDRNRIWRVFEQPRYHIGTQKLLGLRIVEIQIKNCV